MLIWNKINATWIDRYLLAVIMFKWKKPKQSSYQFEKRPQNMIAMQGTFLHAAFQLFFDREWKYTHQTYTLLDYVSSKSLAD